MFTNKHNRDQLQLAVKNDIINFRNGVDYMDEKQLMFQYSLIIDTLKEKRKLLHLTQAEVGDRVGCGRPHIVRYETGVAKPKLDTLIKWANALDCTIVVENKKN